MTMVQCISLPRFDGKEYIFGSRARLSTERGSKLLRKIIRKITCKILHLDELSLDI